MSAFDPLRTVARAPSGRGRGALGRAAQEDRQAGEGPSLAKAL